jgi:phosphodiesterase/alkaline phosphatase D-like protein
MGRVSAVVLAVLGLALVPASAAGAGFSLGVASSEVTSSSALLWAHATGTGKVTLTVKRGRQVAATGSTTPKTGNDLTVRFLVRHLKADTSYGFSFRQGKKTSAAGKFRTAPASSKSRTIRFAFTGDADAQRQPGQSSPYFGNFDVYSAMAREKNDFNINIGDTIYSDTEVPATGSGLVETGTPEKPAAGVALTTAAKWAKYRQNLAMSNLQKLRSSNGVYNHWDDHEFINDFGPNETLVAKAAAGNVVQVPGGSVYGAGVKAFRDYMPVTYSSKDGIYRSFRWGKNLELFFLDERSFRSAKAGSPTIGTCNNPSTNQPDFAPTAPQTIRNEFAFFSPSLALPVSAACIAAINDPNRTLLGARQLGKFEGAIMKSKATFKAIVNEVPIQQFYAAPYDRWEGYAAERTKVLTFLKNNVKNVIFLTTDDHGNIANDARFNTFPSEGGPTNSGIFDVTTGPVATGTFEREINTALNSTTPPGAGRSADQLFFTPQPTATPFPGVGAQCSVINTFSYGEVTVTSSKLTVELKDANRNTVREEEDLKPACPKIVVNKS